ncbi:ScyD/ScyE family protein [Streptacidiphilus sp. MAP12-16]|uniref:ScyD/ScyE family protein n=1 Tax=Streptacidiphilus sp. MAP12-16 TaxID=3156300 RepID=UPI003519A718
MSTLVRSRGRLISASLIGLSSLVAATLGLVSPTSAATAAPANQNQALIHSQVLVPGGHMRVLAGGLKNPRGLAFGPDGRLYVAEGGSGGNASTVGKCPQVPDVGPYTGGFTSRISSITLSGKRTTVVDHLPSSQTSTASGGLVSGVAAVAFLHGRLYAVTAGAGCSHGLRGTHNAVIRIDGHHWREVANLSAFLMSHPVANPNPGDFEPDGTWYSMVADGDDLYAVEPNHGELDRISRGGHVSRVVDVSAHLGHVVPTALATHNDKFYLSNLGTFAVTPGSEFLATATEGGRFHVLRSGLTTVLGLAFDHEGQLFALESSTAAGGPTPGTGKVVEVTNHGLRTVVSGLTFPTGMTFGPDGALYVSNVGFGFPPGAGQILRISLPDKH